MAKKPPKAPTPPLDDFDFDPDRDLNAEVKPVEDEPVAPVDDIFSGVQTSDGEGATRIGGAEEMPEIEVEADEATEEVAADDIFAGVQTDAGEGATRVGGAGEVMPEIEVESDDNLVEVDATAEDEGATRIVKGPQTDELPEVEVDADEVLADVDADEVLSEDEAAPVAADDALVEDDIVDSDLVAMDDDESSPHENETTDHLPAFDEDNAFAGVGEDAEEPAAEVDEDGELVGAGVSDGGGGEGDEPYYEEEIPKPKTHWFTYALIGLNIVASLAAPYMIVLAFQKRQQFTYAVLQHDLAMLGLPNEIEETTITAAKGTLPGYRILPEDIKRVVNERLKTAGPGAPPITDKFEGIDEQIVRRIRPSELDKDILKDHFGPELYIEVAGEPPIKTVEGEVNRLLKTLVPDIKKAADDALLTAGTDDAKRGRIERLLHSLAMDTHQSEKLAKIISESKGKELDKLYTEAVERRMAFDFLLPLELFRPGDAKGLTIERFGNVVDIVIVDERVKENLKGEDLKVLKAMPIGEVLERVEARLKSTIDEKNAPVLHFGDNWGGGKMRPEDIEKRDTIEKRVSIAFTLLSLANVKKPNGDYLYPKLLDRIPLVMGLYDYSLACELFPRRLLAVNERVLERIRIDREGYETPAEGGALARNKSFIDYYEDELQRIRFLQQDIFKAKLRLKDLQDQQTRYAKLLKERTEQRADVLAKIAKSRAKTAVDVAELRRFQDDLHRFQLELATSEDDLARLNDEIQRKLGKRGAQTP